MRGRCLAQEVRVSLPVTNQITDTVGDKGMMGQLGKKMMLTAAALAALTVGSTAQAGMIPVQVSVIPDGGQLRWTYAVVVTTDVQVNAGDSFTIYDFAGL